VAGLSEPVRERRDGDGRTRDTTYPPAPEPLPISVADSHCHLDIRDGEAWLEVEQALSLARAAGIDRIVQIGCDLASSRWSVQAAHAHPSVVAAVALHPNEAPRLAAHGEAMLEDALRDIEAMAADERVRAVGETGLDYFRTGDEGRAAQRTSFERHIAMARGLGKTLVIHDRDAHDDVLQVLDTTGAPEKVVMHCFSGDAAFARECVDRGFYLSFAGTVTFKNAASLREAAAVVPLTNLLVETDAPFLAPAPHRGRPNASYLIPYTVAVLAEAMNASVSQVCAAISANSDHVFGPW